MMCGCGGRIFIYFCVISGCSDSDILIKDLMAVKQTNSQELNNHLKSAAIFSDTEVIKISHPDRDYKDPPVHLENPIC